MMRATIQLLRPRRAAIQRGGFDPKVLGVATGVGSSKLEAIQDALTAPQICGAKAGKGTLGLKIKPGDFIQIIGFRPDTDQESGPEE